MIHIYLKTLEGKQYSFVIDPKLPLTKLIEVVIETTGIMKEELRLVVRQRNLMEIEETKRIEDVDIEDHSVIYVIKRLKKCSCN
jgi:hypothetical protein